VKASQGSDTTRAEMANDWAFSLQTGWKCWTVPIQLTVSVE